MADCETSGFRWHFGEKRPDEVERNPIPSEFFVSETRDLAENFVREAIQNALDARLGMGVRRERAEVRFFLSGREAALPKARARGWFAGLAEHVSSGTSGLRSPPCDAHGWDECEFLTCEDFGTHGLLGDPGQCESAHGDEPADFYNFFRAEALSSKGEGKAGTWGVGKTVFPMASRANAFLGLTVQSGDSRRLLMGRCILRYHKVPGGGATYRSDGFFGYEPDQRGLVMPIQDPSHDAVLDDFAEDFHLLREPGLSGLSVVVPWCRTDRGNGSGVSLDGLRRAVIKHFFWAIVTGALEVTLASPAGDETIDPETIHDALGRLDSDARARLEPVVDLAIWASEQRAAETVRQLDSVQREWHGQPPDWARCLTEEDVTPLTKALERERRIAIRVPVNLVRKRPKQFDQPSHFDVFLEEANDALRPAFHRDLLLICEEPRRPQTVQGFRAIVVADDFGLARFLSVAEVPSHDHWEPNQQELPLDYAYASSVLNFVRYSVRNLGARILDARPPEVDHTLTMEFFPRPDKEAPPPPQPKGPDDEEGDDVTGPPPPVPPSGRPLAIDGVGGSVRISPGTATPDAANVGRRLTVRLAYNIRRGDPLKNWQAVDFTLDDGSLDVSFAGLTEVMRRDNSLSARIEDPGFRLVISGFDPLRDLYVRATVEDEGEQS